MKECMDEIKTMDTHCSNCGRLYQDEHFIHETNRVPYGDTHVNEHIVVGYNCPHCGESEKY